MLSCQSSPSDRVEASPGAQDLARLDAIELKLLDLKLTPDAAGLAGVRLQLDGIASRPGQGRLLSARVRALQGQAALMADDRSGARSFADAAAALSDSEDGVWLVRAGLESDPARRLAVLDLGLAKADRKPRLLCERGEELLRQGRYAEAAQDLDEGLRGLDDRYKALYGADREKALSLAQAVQTSPATAAALSPDALQAPLTIRSMVERAFSGTHLLSALSPRQSPSFEDTRSAVAAAGLLLQPDASPDAPAARRDVAFFLWGIVLRAERNPKLVGMYRSKYSSSPVPDVPADAPWFEATLGLVEREIMDLPDGVHFQPDGAVSRVDYLQMLNRLQKMYP